MNKGLIGVSTVGLKELQDKLTKLTPRMIDAGVEGANVKIVEALKIYPPKSNAKFHWSSEKQRRAFFATKGFGRGIPYQRTQELRNGWQTIGGGKNQIVVNEVGYAKWVQDIATQTIGMMYRGWDVIPTVLSRHMVNIIKAFEGGMRKAIAKK